MIDAQQIGLGTKLRLLLAKLDGELAAHYEAAGLDFRPRFFPVFQLLLSSQRASVAEIARFLQASQPATTQTLVEMKRLNLVSFERGSDKRERIFELTPHALAMAKTMQPFWDATAKAAAQLDSELPYPVSSLIDEAISALNRKGYLRRIAEHHAAAGDFD